MVAIVLGVSVKVRSYGSYFRVKVSGFRVVVIVLGLRLVA